MLRFDSLSYFSIDGIGCVDLAVSVVISKKSTVSKFSKHTVLFSPYMKGKEIQTVYSLEKIRTAISPAIETMKVVNLHCAVTSS